MSLYLAIAITTLISCVIGSLVGYIWYGPLFGRKYGEIMSMDMNDPVKMAEGKKMMPLMMGINFAIMFLTYYAFGFASALLINPGMWKGIIFFSLFIWLGFLMPMAASNSLWSGKSPKASGQLFLITAGYQLVALLLAAVTWVFVYPALM